MTKDGARPKHPSGRPVARDGYRRLPITRVPFNEPLVPGLRRRDLQSAIGFRYEPLRIDDDDDE